MSVPNSQQLDAKTTELLAAIGPDQSAYQAVYYRCQQQLMAVVAIEFPGQLQRRIDEYQGPFGVGYVVVLEYQINGETWLKAVQSGSEAWRSHEWKKISP